MKAVLLTGGAGFVARGLVPTLLSRGWRVRAAVRGPDAAARVPAGAEPLVSGELGPDTDWEPLLEGMDAVLHLAARVHRLGEDAQDAEQKHRRANAGLTRSLAEAAARCGARRFVYLSSVKAMGESTAPGEAWDESSPCRPQDAYGRSKREAEQALLALGGRLEPVVLRAPLVYGPGVGANMARLLSLVDRGWPLPLGSVRNLRSLVFSGNLADAAALALEHPATAGEVFLVSDGEDLSTPELVRGLAAALGRPARLLPFPPALLRLAAAALGRGEEARRLLDSLRVDSGKIRRLLGWKPPYSVEEGLRLTASWWRGR